ncbi:hypothetical protein ACH9DO_14320 [Kocuria sp. M1N1S27]|uniref:hypothetical protein n=1 Tax=Kocuria kalidii TaxID=3376283 RepID=UPI0037B840FD
MKTSDRRSTRVMAVGLFAVAGLGLTACDTEEPVAEEPVVVDPATEAPASEEPATEEPATEEPATGAPATEEPAVDIVYTGPYDQAFIDELDTYTAQDVTVTAEVNETLTPDAFTIGADVDPLLVIETDESIPPVDPGQEVEVTGTVEEIFEIVVVEEDWGLDLDDEMFAVYEGEPYLVASTGDIVAPE